MSRTLANQFTQPYPLILILFLIGLLIINACKPDDDVEASCDSTVLPIIMAHGFLASGDTYATQFQRFTSNNYCPDRLFAYDWNTIEQDNAEDILDAFIDDVLAQTGATQVNLVGHSAGSGLGYSYLADADRAAKVAHYVEVGSGANTQPAGPDGEIPMLNIWSEDDLIVAGGDVSGADNLKLSDVDHYEVATSATTFEAMYEFFNDKPPTTTSIVSEEEILIAGRAVTLGENSPIGGATVNIYALDAATGARSNSEADAVLTTDTDGYWSGFTARPDTHYEFHLIGANADDRAIHYYRQPFVRSNSLVYLRGFPSASSLAGVLLSNVPQDDNQSALAVFTANQAVLFGRDELSVDGFDLATSEYAAPEKTNIAFFLYDDGNNQTDGNTHAVFNLLPAFLIGIDYYIPTIEPASIEVKFNGKVMRVPNLKSETDGTMVVVFD